MSDKPNQPPPQRGQTAQQSLIVPSSLPLNIDYDPRRLFPFGLSPIPELPSELASEVSSICSYSPIPSEDFYETEDEEENNCRSNRSSIMYSGSQSSIKSIEPVTIAENVDSKQPGKNVTDDDTDDDDTCTDDEDSSTEQDYSTSEDSEDETESSEEDADDQKTSDEKIELIDNSVTKTRNSSNEHQHYNSQVMAVMHQRSYQPQDISSSDMQDTTIEQSSSMEVSIENDPGVCAYSTSSIGQDKIPQSSPANVIEPVVNANERTIPLVIEKSATDKESNVPISVSNSSYDTKTNHPALIPQEIKQDKFDATAAGAATASEIFRHLQATRGKEEVTTELAKILTVLKTTLKPKETDSSSTESSDASTDSEDETPNQNIETHNNVTGSSKKQDENSVENSERPETMYESEEKSGKSAPLGKPPIHPNNPLFQSKSANDMPNRLGPQIQHRIKELGSVKPGSGKEEMNILSKILVTLLCSCKSASASSELKKIIRQFRDAATEAADEVPEELRPMSSCSHASSRASKSSKRRKKVRSRKSSATSSNSQSEAESLTNTLTPCNTDSKSSGTEDEGGNPELINKSVSRSASVPRSASNTPVTSQTRLHFNVTVEDPPTCNINSEAKVGDEDKKSSDPNVTFTVSLPKRASVSPTKNPIDDGYDENEKISNINGTHQEALATKSSYAQSKEKVDDYECDDDEWEWEY